MSKRIYAACGGSTSYRGDHSTLAAAEAALLLHEHGTVICYDLVNRIGRNPLEIRKCSYVKFSGNRHLSKGRMP